METALRVFKYDIERTDFQQIKMHSVEAFLHVGVQHGKLRIWALVDVESDQSTVRLYVVGTGNPTVLTGNEVFIGTCFDGPFVWHVFSDLP